MIAFFSEEIDFQLDTEETIKAWVSDTIIAESQNLGEINYIFCSDEYLHKMNVEYLDHNTYTDIITFNYCEGSFISGDLFISIDRVTENAKTFKNGLQSELHRVLIHGVLHLIGYNDKTDQEIETMRSKEDFYLSLLSI